MPIKHIILSMWYNIFSKFYTRIKTSLGTILKQSYQFVFPKLNWLLNLYCLSLKFLYFDIIFSRKFNGGCFSVISISEQGLEMFSVLCATSRKKISFFEERVGGEEVLVVGLCGLEKLLRRNALDAAASRVSNGRKN